MNKLSIQKIALSENAKAQYKNMYLATFKRLSNDISELDKVFILFDELKIINPGVAEDFLKDIRLLVKNKKVEIKIDEIITDLKKQKSLKTLEEYLEKLAVMFECVVEEFFSLGYGSYDDIAKDMLEALSFE